MYQKEAKPATISRRDSQTRRTRSKEVVVNPAVEVSQNAFVTEWAKLLAYTE